LFHQSEIEKELKIENHTSLRKDFHSDLRNCDEEGYIRSLTNEIVHSAKYLNDLNGTNVRKHFNPNTTDHNGRQTIAGPNEAIWFAEYLKAVNCIDLRKGVRVE